MKRIFLLLLLGCLAVTGFSQNPNGTGNLATPQVQFAGPAFIVTALSATAAAGSPAVLTIPAPANPSVFNYVCSLYFNGSNANSGAVLTNAVSTSSNFALGLVQNAATTTWATKVSAPSVASNDTAQTAEGSASQLAQALIINSTPGGGCAKSSLGGTATVFTSATVASWAFAWMATYYQAP